MLAKLGILLWKRARLLTSWLRGQDFERDARRVRVKFTKSIWRVSWPRRNAASYQPSFFHNYLTLIALYKLKNKEKQKKTITQVWPRTSGKHEWLWKTLQKLIVSWNYNSTDGYHIPRVSIHNGMYGELCVVPIYSLPQDSFSWSSLRFLTHPL